MTAQRGLHLIDLENLCCRDPHDVDLAVAGRALNSYLERAQSSPADLLVVGVNPMLAHVAREVLPTARLVVGKGPDGADHALLGAAVSAEFVAARFARLIIGSGDGAFIQLAQEVRSLGVEVTAIGMAGHVHRRLAGATDHCSFIVPEPNDHLARAG